MNELRYLEYEDRDETLSFKEEMGIGVITELSRQLRTFFNLKSAVVRARFLRAPSPILPSEKVLTSAGKERFMEQSINFVELLNEIPPQEKSMEERLQLLTVHALNPNDRAKRGLFVKLHKSMEGFFRELHVYSEKELTQDLRVLEQICKMAALLCEVKASLNTQLSEYFFELVEHYMRLSREMREILAQEKTFHKSTTSKTGVKNGLKVRIRA